MHRAARRAPVHCSPWAADPGGWPGGYPALGDGLSRDSSEAGLGRSDLIVVLLVKFGWCPTIIERARRPTRDGLVSANAPHPGIPPRRRFNDRRTPPPPQP